MQRCVERDRARVTPISSVIAKIPGTPHLMILMTVVTEEVEKIRYRKKVNGHDFGKTLGASDQKTSVIRQNVTKTAP